MSFSWHFSFSWQQLGSPVRCGNNLYFFLTQKYTNFMMLLDRSDFHSWAAQTSWITWHRWFYDLKIRLIFYHISYHISFQNKQKSSKNPFLAVESSYYKKQREVGTFWQNFNRLVLRAKKIFLIRVKFFHLSLGLFFRFMLFPEASAQVWKTLRYA